MHDIPKDFNLDLVVGSTVTKFVFREHDFSLVIAKCSITGSGKLELDCNGNIRVIFQDEKPKENNGPDLILGQKVKEWHVEGKRTFSITLDNEALLRFIGESDQYEDFQINHAGKLQIV